MEKFELSVVLMVSPMCHRGQATVSCIQLNMNQGVAVRVFCRCGLMIWAGLLSQLKGLRKKRPLLCTAGSAPAQEPSCPPSPVDFRLT